MSTIMSKEIKRHIYNHRTMVCRCGRTFEQHKNIELMSEKWKMNNFEGKVNIKKMFEELDKVIKI